jgi:hypothetical protein
MKQLPESRNDLHQFSTDKRIISRMHKELKKSKKRKNE